MTEVVAHIVPLKHDQQRGAEIVDEYVETLLHEISVLRWALGRLVGHSNVDDYLNKLKTYEGYPRG